MQKSKKDGSCFGTGHVMCCDATKTAGDPATAIFLLQDLPHKDGYRPESSGA